MSPTTILVVDDDHNVLEVLEARLSAAGFNVLRASRAEEALTLLSHSPVTLIISDVKMPGMGGMDLLRTLRGRHPDLPVIMLTAYGTIPDAVAAVKSGAVDYIAKPFDGRTLVAKIHELLSASQQAARSVPAADAAAPAVPAAPRADRQDAPEALRSIDDLIPRVAASDVSVLILGESGVGKEYVARRIHEQGPRADKPFVVVDCGATPSGLLESELFGHARGAFTHAIQEKRGLIEIAHQGTLFLDEIGNISSEMQMRLLRFLESRRIRRVGGLHEIPVDCRIIAATNADLETEMGEGRFRSDLYYRLRVMTLTVPPLRDRREEIVPLARQFMAGLCQAQGRPAVQLSEATLETLLQHPWPGNVRELKNILEAGLVLCHNGILRPEDLHLSGWNLAAALAPPSEAPPPPDADAAYSLEENERLAIVRALERSGGIQKEAAELLGISRRAIHYKIKKYGIVVSRRRTARA